MEEQHNAPHKELHKEPAQSRTRLAVRGMAASFPKQVGQTPTERMYSDVAAPSALYLTVNPQFTLLKARELYGGEPRPLLARHEFIKQAFLSDTEDWRSNAHIGSKRGAVSRMNIVDPRASSYLKDASKRKMSYYREKSLKRAISYRAVLVKRDGMAAENQYTDQYLDRADVQRAVRSSMAGSAAGEEGARQVQRQLSRSLSSSPARMLASSLSKALHVGEDDQMARRGSKVTIVADERPASPGGADLGARRAVSRIMSRARVDSMRKSAGGSSVRWSDHAGLSEDVRAAQSADGEEAAPTFDDL